MSTYDPSERRARLYLMHGKTNFCRSSTGWCQGCWFQMTGRWGIPSPSDGLRSRRGHESVTCWLFLASCFVVRWVALVQCSCVNVNGSHCGEYPGDRSLLIVADQDTLNPIWDARIRAFLVCALWQIWHAKARVGSKIRLVHARDYLCLGLY